MRIQDLISTKLYFPVLAPLSSTPKNPIRWRIRRMVREKERLMRRPLAEIEQHQAERIHELLVHAARNCEFYRARFVAVGLTHERDLTIKNLQLVPVLSKHDVQQCLESLLPTGVNRRTWRQNF